MKAVLHDDLASFLAVAGWLYEADAVRHTVALTVLSRLPHNPSPRESAPLLVTVHDDGELRGAAFCTPPWPLGVSGLPVNCAPAAADLLASVGVDLTGVTGPSTEASAFASAWSSATGRGAHVAISQRLYRLTELTVPQVPGTWRLATEQDVPRLGQWHRAFAEEATGHLREPPSAQEMALRSLAAGDANVLWEIDGAAVAWACARNPVVEMSRIGPVYTPGSHRGRGYGSAVTAAASEWARGSGAREVVLFTDLANPVSNSIYQRIGYRPVLDAVEVAFTAA
jgi:predicted GNAT family acetyltransferase